MSFEHDFVRRRTHNYYYLSSGGIIKGSRMTIDLTHEERVIEVRYDDLTADQQIEYQGWFAPYCTQEFVENQVKLRKRYLEQDSDDDSYPDFQITPLGYDDPQGSNAESWTSTNMWK